MVITAIMPPKTWLYLIVRFDSHLQEQASLLFVNLSSSILYMDVNKTEENEINNAANLIVEGASNILDYSSNVSRLTLRPALMGLLLWGRFGDVNVILLIPGVFIFLSCILFFGMPVDS